jgi:hypothetical protein
MGALGAKGVKRDLAIAVMTGMQARSIQGDYEVERFLFDPA